MPPLGKCVCKSKSTRVEEGEEMHVRCVHDEEMVDEDADNAMAFGTLQCNVLLLTKQPPQQTDDAKRTQSHHSNTMYHINS